MYFHGRNTKLWNDDEPEIYLYRMIIKKMRKISSVLNSVLRVTSAAQAPVASSALRQLFTAQTVEREWIPESGHYPKMHALRRKRLSILRDSVRPGFEDGV
jgi:hypothetical protein